MRKLRKQKPQILLKFILISFISYFFFSHLSFSATKWEDITQSSNSNDFMYCKQINTGEVTKFENKDTLYNCPTGYKKTNASDYKKNKRNYNKVVYCKHNHSNKVLQSKSGLCLNNYSITSKLEYDKYKSIDLNKNSQNKVSKKIMNYLLMTN